MTRTAHRSGLCPQADRPVARAAAVLLSAAAAAGPVHAELESAGNDPAARICRGPDPFEIRLVPTAHANGAEGTVRLVFAESPFVVSVTAEGHHKYEARVATAGLGERTGALVVWAATPELDEVRKLGVLNEQGTLEAAPITFNKFLVFVTEEPHAEVERWTGRILLRGISPSGRMHTMAGHGPFQGESCGGLFGPQW